VTSYTACWDDLRARLDQTAQDRPLRDDAGVVGRVGGGRDALDERVQVRHTADALQVPGVGQGRRHGDAVGRLAPPVQVQDGVEDRGVHRAVEIMRFEDLDDVGDGVLGQQHAAQHALLGCDVLGRRFFEPARGRRSGAGLGSRVVGDRHPDLLRSPFA
jgi:hypothetical protein